MGGLRWTTRQTNMVDAFVARRIRMQFQGRIARVFDFYFNPDFAGGTVAVRDAYFDTRFSNAFRIRAGKSKTPFGIERLQSASCLLFVERGLPTAVAPIGTSASNCTAIWRATC